LRCGDGPAIAACALKGKAHHIYQIVLGVLHGVRAEGLSTDLQPLVYAYLYDKVNTE
jgi:hypothetical protein